MAVNAINTVKKRRALAERHAPYWETVRRGVHVGFHKSPTGGTWRARATGPDGKYQYQVLGDAASLDYDEAAAKALEFADMAARTVRADYTVKDAITDYVAHLRKTKGARAAADAEGRLTKHALPVFGGTTLVELRSRDLSHWLRTMVSDDTDELTQRRSKSTANRAFNSLKAALNLAFIEGIAPSDAEWRRVRSFRNADAARELFLTTAQVEALLNATMGAFRDLVRAAVLIGARYGELAGARVRDLDHQGGTLHLDGKTGPRSCYLSADALAFFRGLARDKLPDSWLLMREDGTPWGKSNQQKPFQKAARSAELPPEAVFYSLRHYHISRALLAGIPIQVIAENCGTSVRMIERHYGKFMATDRRSMMDRVAL